MDQVSVLTRTRPLASQSARAVCRLVVFGALVAVTQYPLSAMQPSWEWGHAVAIDHSGTHVYVALRGSQTISVVDAKTNKNVLSIPVSVEIHELFMGLPGPLMYATGRQPPNDPSFQGFGAYAIVVIDTTSNTVIGRTIVIAREMVAPSPALKRLSQTGRFRAAAHRFATELMDMKTGTSVLIPWDASVNETSKVALNPLNNRIYAAETQRRTVEARPLPGGGSQALRDVGKGTIYVLADGNVLGETEVFEESYDFKHTFPRARGVFGTLAVHPNGAELCVVVTAAEGSNFLFLIDVTNEGTPKVVAKFPLKVRPEAIALNPSGSRMYVSDSEAGTVSILDSVTYGIINTVRVEKFPTGMAMSPSGDRIYVANSASQTVSVIDTSTARVIATITI